MSENAPATALDGFPPLTEEELQELQELHQATDPPADPGSVDNDWIRRCDEHSNGD